MLLLTSIYDNLSVKISSEDNLTALVPRLFPFFRHALSSVRLATLRCMSSLLFRSATPAAWLLPAQLLPALRLTFQNLVIESDAKIVEATRVGLAIDISSRKPSSVIS
jgi:TATA-binding protein-associated factor